MNAIVDLRRRAIGLAWASVLYLVVELLSVGVGVTALLVAGASDGAGLIVQGGSAAVGAIAMIPIAAAYFAIRAGNTARARTNAARGRGLMVFRLVAATITAVVVLTIVAPTDSVTLPVLLTALIVGDALVGLSFARSVRADAYRVQAPESSSRTS
jgi:hypothetical protein